MMNSRGLSALLFLLTLIGVTGCYFPVSPSGQVAETTVAPPYATVSAILTATSAQRKTEVPTETPQATPLLSTPSQTQPVSTRDLANSGTPEPTITPTKMCDLAQAGVPIDVSIPDDSPMRPGESFAKIWRLVNAGSCTWSHEYTLVWFSGDDLGVRREEPINTVVAPGQNVDLSVDMIAPEKAGVYQSNWKLRNHRGELFGIGPGGGAPFWVRIKVEQQDTATPTTVPPTLTSTPVISSSGSASLAVGQGFDLDAGQVISGSDTDFILEAGESQLRMVPQNGSRIANHGATVPSLSDCQSSALSADPTGIGSEFQGRYLCFQTTKGLPGYLLLELVDTANAVINIQYLVWSVP